MRVCMYVCVRVCVCVYVYERKREDWELWVTKLKWKVLSNIIASISTNRELKWNLIYNNYWDVNCVWLYFVLYAPDAEYNSIKTDNSFFWYFISAFEK